MITAKGFEPPRSVLPTPILLFVKIYIEIRVRVFWTSATMQSPYGFSLLLCYHHHPFLLFLLKGGGGGQPPSALQGQGRFLCFTLKRIVAGGEERQVRSGQKHKGNREIYRHTADFFHSILKLCKWTSHPFTVFKR